MNSTELINIDLISPNPFQVRDVEDPAAVAELAANIEKNGLLQPPTVRKAGNKYEIAFGHTRLAAFKLLVSQDKGSVVIPCFIRELDDLQMFEMAVAENIKRRDLNPIERARAMHTYMTTFEKTSAETGEFFNCNESTVRGSVRLLGLPEPAQEKLASGEITVDNARKLLTVQQMAGAEAVLEAVEELSREGKSVSVDEIIDSQVRANTKGVEMWSHWRDQDKPQAGPGLWLLNLSDTKFPNEHLPVLTESDAAKALEQEFTSDLREQLKGWIATLNFNPQSGPDLVREGAPEADVERLAHLIAPPACTACPFYARMNKTHYCAFAACHKRKTKAWAGKELVRLSKKLDLPVYDSKEHGRQIYPLKSNWNDNGEYEKIFDAKTDVCLGIKVGSQGSMYGNKHDFTDSYLVHAIAVGKTAEKLLTKKEAKDKGQDEYEQQYVIQRQNRGQSNRFVKDVAIPFFATAFAALEQVEPMIAIVNFDADDEDYQKASKGRKLEILRQELAGIAMRHCSYQGDFPDDNGPIAVAKYLQGVAKTWGLKLPKDWLKQADSFLEGLTEYEGADGKLVKVDVVSAETEKE